MDSTLLSAGLSVVSLIDYTDNPRPACEYVRKTTDINWGNIYRVINQPTHLSLTRSCPCSHSPKMSLHFLLSTLGMLYCIGRELAEFERLPRNLRDSICCGLPGSVPARDMRRNYVRNYENVQFSHFASAGPLTRVHVLSSNFAVLLCITTAVAHPVEHCSSMPFP